MKVKKSTASNNTIDDRVTTLPGVGRLTNTQFAGYVPVDPADQITPESESLFYWFVGTKDYANKPTILWTNGGPGSTSFWGFFTENGPYQVERAGTKKKKPVLTERPTAWNSKVNYLIFEHPLGVTYSFPKKEENVPPNPAAGAQQYYHALQNFLDKHPELRDNKIVLSGESYAGTYLPQLAKCIYEAEANNIALASVVLLDAWVDPITQMTMDTTYAYTHGLISKRQKEALDREYNILNGNLNQLNWHMQQMTGVYMTNIAKTQDPPIQPVLDYLNRPDVREALHVSPTAPPVQSWSKAVSYNYTSFLNTSQIGVIETLLEEAQYTIQIINGLNDAKDCNFLGTEAWLERLNGTVAETFHNSLQKPWKDEQKNTIGFIQDGGRLSWVKVMNAGHMAVMDQPLILDVIMEKAGI